MNRFFKLLFSRISITLILIILQLSILVIWIWNLSEDFIYLYTFSLIIGLIMTIYIVSRPDNPSFKLAWLIPILLFPILGVLLYIFFGGHKLGRKLKKRIEKYYYDTINYLKQDEDIIKEIEKKDKTVASQVKYISDLSTFPIYKNTSSKYLSSGEKFYEELIKELKQAKKFIFMEYFIIEEGFMWNSILEILKDKVKEGVEVRLIYDDVGCAQTLPKTYSEKLNKLGIKTLVFNQMLPVLSAVLNNRDHRKITIIDGHTAFTGGINLADEYINKIQKFGHWKDSAIMIKGEAVWSFTIMFLEVWSFSTNKKEVYEKYKFTKALICNEDYAMDGYVQPYGDSPFNNELVGENIYLNMINKAKDYVYICTPYLIIDNELVTALTLAAKSGVDVRIVTPHIEDKWYIHIVTRAYYNQLIKYGVKIYEYTPGFIHSKIFVVDDYVATVGSINLDYRSLYLHFECGVYLYNTSSVLEIKKDYENTLNISQRITIEDTRNVKWSNRFLRSIIRLFAPLL
ncbi:MAG: cardiolipin synthase [Clostridium sp.]|nr:cardiolipin synthase [Clostridium sp.]